MKCGSSGAVHTVMFTSLILLIMATAATAQMDNPPPKSWDDYEDDLFADAAKRMQGMTGFRDRYRPSWWPSRGRNLGWNTGLYRSNYGPPAPFLGRRWRLNSYDSGRNTFGNWYPGFRPRSIRRMSRWTY